MLAWLLIWPLVISASLVFTSPESGIAIALTTDARALVFSKLGFADLYQISCASKDLRMSADKAIKALYGIQHAGRPFLNYTLIIRELNALLNEAKAGSDKDKCNAVDKSSPHISCILSILEPRLGGSIRRSCRGQARFYAGEVFVHIIQDPRKLSALPYIIDEEIDNLVWIDLIRELAELGRFDLLGQMTFLGIDQDDFYQLMSVVLPESIRLTAVKSLQMKKPKAKLSKVLAVVESGSPTALALLPPNYRPPLFILQQLYEKNALIPENWIFKDGLKESSIPFWISVCTSGAERAAEILNFILERGNNECRYLARAFCEPVSLRHLRDQKEDVYQAMLIRFHFSPIRNEHVAQNYNLMIDRRLELGYHTACALLDFRQYSLLDRSDLTHLRRLSAPHLGALIERVYQLQDDRLEIIMARLVRDYEDAPELLKSFIMNKANDSYARLVWSAIQTRPYRSATDYCCCASLEGLRRLVFEQSMSIEDAERILSMLDGFWTSSGATISKAAHAFNTVMFWEASERVVNYFLDQVPNDHRIQLDCAPVDKVFRLAKYSREFREKVTRRYEQQHCDRLPQPLVPKD